MRVRLHEGNIVRTPGTRAGGALFSLVSPELRLRLFQPGGAKETVAYFKSRIALLSDPETAVIKAVCRVWAKNGGERQIKIGSWKHGDRESLGMFVSRVNKAVRAIPSAELRPGQDGWLDGADL